MSNHPEIIAFHHLPALRFRWIVENGALIRMHVQQGGTRRHRVLCLYPSHIIFKMTFFLAVNRQTDLCPDHINSGVYHGVRFGVGRAPLQVHQFVRQEYSSSRDEGL